MLKRISKLFVILFTITVLFAPINVIAQDSTKNPAKKDPKKEWDGGVEAGSTVINGNTKQESLFGKADIKYKKNKWGNNIKSRVENTKTDRQRVRERYDFNNSLRYDYSEFDFALFELEYIDDRYGGYDYRVSESIGYGHYFFKDKEFSLSSQVGGGSRQSKFTDGDKEESWLVRVGGDLQWKINKDIEFKQHLDFSFDRETEITRSDTSLKIKMGSVSDSLYFSLSYFLERKSNTISPGIKNTDSTMMFMLGYSL